MDLQIFTIRLSMEIDNQKFLIAKLIDYMIFYFIYEDQFNS